ncbi:MAG TPA: ATP-binding protein [Flavilitoribacter sp.]|nr:ATP-binding protein [Flavilitoribacter sp.]HMQ87545.1 ATP-binding protein [Flavilitoribacter sp.]
MEKIQLTLNAKTLEGEFNWLTQVIHTRFKLYFGQESEFSDIREIEPPSLTGDPSLYARIACHYPFSVEERLMVLLTLAPHIQPQALDLFFTKNSIYDRGYTEFGGLVGQNHSGFLPTGETAQFLIAGNDLQYRMQLTALFDEQHFFFRHNILRLASGKPEEPFLSGALTLSAEYLAYFTTGDDYHPNYSTNFPAKSLTTELDWPDLILDPHILEEIEEIIAWIRHNDKIRNEWELGSRIKPGYRSLFYGPPGTGKTLTASLMGKTTGLSVYRIDLSQVVSKYIGETEKNLANVFDQAENKNWILFFDEADALFGKRTSTKDAKDRYANQEIAYLLQRIEDFPGVVILATNMKDNIDDAFARRFQSMIYFPVPDAEQRYLLWKMAFSDKLALESKIDLHQVAEKYELSGGGIINVLRYAAIAAVRRDSNSILLQDILRGIRREFRKEGKTV